MMTFDFWPGYLEIFKAVGFNFVLLDLEHGSASLQQTEELCRTARLLELPLILRPETSQYHVARKYLDMGPAGVMIPRIEVQDQVDSLRDALFIPPRGRRGPGGPAIFANRSLDRAGWEEIESCFFVMLQIETLRGLNELDRLGRADWVDAVMPGPYDLSLQIGQAGEIDHPDVVATICRIREETAKIAKPCGMVLSTPDQAKPWIARGFHFFIISEPVMMALHYARFLVENIRRWFDGEEREAVGDGNCWPAANAQ